MGTISGSSVILNASTSAVVVNSPDLGYIVILLMIMTGLLAVDLMRRLFTRD